MESLGSIKSWQVEEGRVWSPSLGGLDPHGPGKALGMLWYQECAEQDFVSSWTIFGVDSGFSDPFPHACGPRCVQTSLCPHESFQAGIGDHSPALPHKLRKLFIFADSLVVLRFFPISVTFFQV